ncbi:MAG: Glycosyl transferase family 2 [Candidatus Amesbacteria bacterium GW2011_GWA1_47_16]|uniref:Glycosyl transferase family 2 n=4 Tax=Candidatus Amesiibacteriota TaxID=1752730 RepID=A0A0G1UFR3_9BACT|nr:MAG: Glycosyl transferase family 2 [Candidatus Amesbacteria bacterium GW2011_GWC1_47_15]KKU65103.1 MAG: Glycosyl transferase family 2 [Candidatus Amesbacteria bacterium GW2011_GWA1_47_16]KKU97810.1 MAG: Glycosyl transferase family 2 [Candidatus Amesbacteria bacterium GW2011_GWB1_48_13]OGC99177.1 MAG: hypothetical protein A2701_02105 [Candidatus Amesbacteria bacterium RIFCSPHIGHO2_01_FULL_47_34]OGD00944.1 MAG: hypothetical protein A2972_03175 [Candidatus Amesbacteria bacterium RIFCSPLOWO2_01_
MFSVAIIAKNAADVIGSCIESVSPLTTDIVVVVDSSSSDTTSAVAEKSGARVFHRQFDDFASQKNYAVSLTKFKWVLSLDADETASEELIKEIKSAVPGTRFAAFAFPRINYIFGKSIYHTNWSPASDKHVWLFDKTRSHWENAVHERVSVDGPVGSLSAPKYHFHYRTVEEFLHKTNQYTTLDISSGSQSRFSSLIRPHWLRLILQPKWKFFRHYFLFAGFLDGWHGLFLSYLMAVYGACLAVKSWQKQNPHTS